MSTEQNQIIESNQPPTEAKRSLYLTPTQTKLLFGYYFIVFIAAFASSCAIFVPGPLSRFDFMELALIGAASMACIGSAVYYTRKLYKAVLGETLIRTQGDDLKTFATFVYFFARPLFSLAFALLIVIGLKSGLILSGAQHGSLSYGFIQLVMFLSFFVGFLSGRFLRQLESWGERMLERVSSGDIK